jgi:hypothetical protein
MNFLQQTPDPQSQQAFFNQSNYPPANTRSFGSFSNEAVATNATHSMFATDDLALFGYEDGHDQSDPKRRRIARVSLG